MLEVRKARGKDDGNGGAWKDAESVFRWWIDEKWNPDQVEIKDWLYEIGVISVVEYNDDNYVL